MTTARQLSLDDLGTPLSQVSFVVVDLETTGGAPEDAGITEIGAVRVTGGRVDGEFQTLVNPGRSIPAFICALTGITDTMVAGAPAISAALPAFLEFARGSVLVAHNAPYDMGFLKGACAVTQTAWPGFSVIDTVRLARTVLHRDEVRNVKLATLAAALGASTQPSHRALDDARATVDVLHALLERAGTLGVHTLEDLSTHLSRVTAVQRRKRSLADGLPDAPGVYIFEDAQGRALYVGTSRSLRTRVRTYFTASETRARMAQMIALAARVVPLVCATRLEAQVRETRLIAERQPPFNRRSRHPERAVWLSLTADGFPRLATVRQVRAPGPDGSAPTYIGPFPGARAAQQAAEALLEAVPLRTCSQRLSTRRADPAAGCLLAEMGRCLAPCRDLSVGPDYRQLAERARAAMTTDVDEVVRAVESRMSGLIAAERYEEAADWRDRLHEFVSGVHRAQQMSLLARTPHLVAARLGSDLAWEIHVIRHGRLAASGRCAPGEPPRDLVASLVALAEDVPAPCPPAPAGLLEEARLLQTWLDSPGVRLVQGPGLALPIGAGGRAAHRLDQVRREVQARGLLARDARR